MHIEAFERHEDGTRVLLRPSAEDGIFVLEPGRRNVVGWLIRLYDVRTPDALAAELGDLSVLRTYVLPSDLNKSVGVYFIPGSGTLLDQDGNKITNFSDSKVREYAPFVPPP